MRNARVLVYVCLGLACAATSDAQTRDAEAIADLWELTDGAGSTRRAASEGGSGMVYIFDLMDLPLEVSFRGCDIGGTECDDMIVRYVIGSPPPHVTPEFLNLWNQVYYGAYGTLRDDGAAVYQQAFHLGCCGLDERSILYIRGAVLKQVSNFPWLPTWFVISRGMDPKDRFDVPDD